MILRLVRSMGQNLLGILSLFLFLCPELVLSRSLSLKINKLKLEKIYYLKVKKKDEVVYDSAVQKIDDKIKYCIREIESSFKIS